ncbi:MAG: histidine kinase [Lachnospiraceae bacterium]|nr:histidine kinase [Lachnospiraceae bacterium]
MKKSWINRVMVLLAGTLITSLLFLAVITVTYNSFYRQNVLGVNNGIAANWASSVDSRLNTIYEHVYDLTSSVFKKAEVRADSPAMNYTIQTELQNSLDSKVWASSDVTMLFVMDTESDLFLASVSRVVSSGTNAAIKSFLREYAPTDADSVANKKWTVITINKRSYYYKGLSLGRYIIGAVAECSTFAPDAYGDNGNTTPTCFIEYDGEIFFGMGDKAVGDFIDFDKKGDYFIKGYAVSTSHLSDSDVGLVYITKPQGLKISLRIASMFMIVDSALCVVLIGMLFVNLDKKVRIPIKELVIANEELSDGDLDYRLDVNDAGSSEFEELYGSFNEMSEKIGNLTIESYDLKIKREQNRLKMLRAQMQPHTFLNGITTISNMTYNKAPEEIRKYISDFAAFTRYMLHTATDWTTVEEELKHIDNYVDMQKLRFPNSIELSYDVPEEVQASKVPYLILFSLVENSFKHAMTLVNTMYVKISGEVYEEPGFKGIRLIEEDNGSGFSDEALEKINNPENDEMFTKEHLGLTNVRYSLKLIFNRDDLLRLSNREDGGAHVELLIPYGEYEDETFGM